VAAARRGIYSASAFRAVGPEMKRTYFTDKVDGSHVNDRVRQNCHFGHLNLMDSERVRIVGRVDAVFCRNVLIYFDQRSRKKVIDMFYERLVPGGFLFLGHSESLLNVSTAFELVHLTEDLVYRKPLISMAARSGGGA
jgi:chemotaxis protein methyltransferase CheR